MDKRSDPERATTKRKRDILEARRTQADIQQRILHARRVLIGEAVQIFGICKAVSGWSIAGIELPIPGELRSEMRASPTLG